MSKLQPSTKADQLHRSHGEGCTCTHNVDDHCETAKRMPPAMAVDTPQIRFVACTGTPRQNPFRWTSPSLLRMEKHRSTAHLEQRRRKVVPTTVRLPVLARSTSSRRVSLVMRPKTGTES